MGGIEEGAGVRREVEETSGNVGGGEVVGSGGGGDGGRGGVDEFAVVDEEDPGVREGCGWVSWAEDGRGKKGCRVSETKGWRVAEPGLR